MKCPFCNEEMRSALDDEYWCCDNDDCKHKQLESKQRHGVKLRQYMIKK